MSTKNIKIPHDTFIDAIYELYQTMLAYDMLTPKGFETDKFKIWKFDNYYYILSKTTGILISWYKLLGWNLSSNTKIDGNMWKTFCSDLYTNLTENEISITRIENN